MFLYEHSRFTIIIRIFIMNGSSSPPSSSVPQLGFYLLLFQGGVKGDDLIADWLMRRKEESDTFP